MTYLLFHRLGITESDKFGFYMRFDADHFIHPHIVRICCIIKNSSVN